MSNPQETEPQNSDRTDKQQKKEKPKKKYDPIDYYLQDTYVDAKDSTNSWCVARIIERCDDDHTLKINFDGWSHKWDEWLRFTSSRLSPFRKYSVGYTGQSKFAIRDFKFNIEEAKQKTEKLEEVLASNFASLATPFEITQYFRGSEYFYIDSMLQYDYKKPREELPYVLNYFKTYFQVYIRFLQQLPHLIPEYLDGIANPDAFLTNPRIALSLCLYEMSDAFNKILGNSERLWNEFSAYDSEEYEISLSKSQEYAGKDINLVWTTDSQATSEEDTIPKKKEKKYSQLIGQLINLFGELGGFQAWIGALTFFKEEQTEPNTDILLPPFKVMATLITNISNIYVYLNKSFQDKLFPQVKSAILRRLKFISDKEIKDLDRDVLIRFLNRSLNLLVTYYPQDEIFLMTETAELDLSLRFLTCPYFEKRLRGINEIKELTEKIDMYEHFERNPKQYSSIYSQKVTKKLNAKMFLEWINKNKVFEIILGDSIHIEIIKRTNEILKFIAKYENLPLSLLDLLWNARVGKHEAISVGIDNLIVEIADIIHAEGINYLKQKINSIPDEEQNEASLNLIKGFALKTLPSPLHLASLEDDEAVDESKFHCIDTLWRLTLDQSKVSSALSENALLGLVNVLKERECQGLKKVYLYRCMEKIKKRDSVHQSINLVHSLLNNTYQTHRYDIENSLATILEKMDTDFDLIELVVSEFEDFHKKVNDIVSKKSSEPTEDEREKIYFGKYSYSANFKARFDFLEYLLTNPAYELSLSLKQIEKIWDLLALNPIWEFDRDYFFKWISKNHESNLYSSSNSVLTKEVIPKFFEKIICNSKKFDFINMSPKAFECFNTYFKIVNEINQKFRLGKGAKFTILDLSYEGKDTLWNIFLNCRHQTTVNKVVNLLVKCCLSLGVALEKQKKKLCEEFTLKCVNLLKEGYQRQNDRLISKAVLLLMHFFDSFEGKNRLDTSDNDDKGRSGVNMTTTVVLKPENTIKTITVNSNHTIGYVRNLIGDTFGLPVNGFKIYSRGNIVENDDDDTPLHSYPIGRPCIIYKVPAANKTEETSTFHPKHIMTQNTEYVDLLFKLLSEDVQELINSIAVNAVWDLLMRLPINEKIKTSLYEVSDSWENLLEIQSLHLHRLLYCLQIIEDFLIDKETERMQPVNLTDTKASPPFKDRDWMQKFYKTGGVRTFFDLIRRPEISNLKTIISVKCLTILLKITCYFFTNLSITRATFQAIVGEKSSEVETAVVQRIVTIIHNTCEYSLLREQSETEADRRSQIKIKAVLPNYQEDPVQLPENLYYESELITYSQSLLLIAIQRNPSLLNLVYKYPGLESMLSIGLIESGNVYLKENLSHGIFSLLVEFQKTNIQPTPHQFFVPLLLQSTLQKALGHQERSEVFFRMLSNIVNQVNFAEINFNFDKLLTQLVKFIKERKPKERSQKDTDTVLYGILQLLRGLFWRFPNKAQKYGQDEKLALEVLQNCLFEIPRRSTRKEVAGPKCKSHLSRHAAFKLLLELARGSNDNLRDIINYIAPIHRNGTWRTKRYVDWHITQKDNEKSSTGYVGIKNLGCICYMNSTIQQLYMIPSFRKAVLEVEDKSLATTPREDNVLYQLKCIFAALNESEKQYFNPKNFCQAFKDYDGNPTNVYEQMDADEFFNMFMDRLENQIKGTKLEHFIKHHFGGVVSNELICKGCPHYSEREEPFLTVNLQVKGKKNIDQSLAAFVEGEMLEGDNAFHCAICDKKVSTLKRVCLKKLPNHLILVLKRFEFDYDTMTKVKVNDYCEFPMKLNVEPYTQQGLRKAEQAKKKEEDQKEEKQENDPTQEYPSSYFEYKLTGVVIHLGFADSGHYYSLIQDNEVSDSSGENRWYEFNDEAVSNFDSKDIPSEAFGGEEKWKYYGISDNMSSSYKEKIKNAYLLFYERIVPYSPEESVETKESQGTPKKTEESKEDKDEIQRSAPNQGSGNKQTKAADSDRRLASESTTDLIKKEEDLLTEDDLKKNLPQDFLKELAEKNQKFQTHRNIFSREYFEFVGELITQQQFVPNNTYQETYHIDPVKQPREYHDLEVLKFGILFLLTAIIRDKPRTGIIKMLPFLKRQLRQNVPACLWLLDMFTSKKIQLEFFLDCNVSDMQRFVVGLVATAFKVVYNYEGKGSQNRLFDISPTTKIPTTILANFINCCIHTIFEAKENNRDFTEFFRIFCEMSSCGPEVIEYLIAKEVIGRLMDFFYDTVSPLTDYFRNMSDVEFQEPTNLELGQPQEEKKKIRSAWEEYMLKRKEKYTFENHSAKKSYVWKTIALLIPYCKVVSTVSTRCEWQIGDYDCELNQKEKTLLTPNVKHVDKVIRDASSKMGYRSIAFFYSYLCYEDPKFTGIFLKAIQAGMKEGESSSIKSFMRCFRTLLELNDSYSQKRCQELCEFLLQLMEENNNYFIEMDSYTTFLIKLLERVETVRAWFLDNLDKLEPISSWINEHPVPPVGVLQNNIRLNKKRPALGTSSLKHDVKEYRARSRIKANKLKAFTENNLPMQKDEWDSDDDLADHEFVLGEKLDFLPQPGEKWCTAEVENILEEMINLSYSAEDGEQQRHWIAKDAENIAVYKGMQKRQEEIEEEIEKIAAEAGGDTTPENGNDQDKLTDHDDSHKGEDNTDSSCDLSVS